VILVAVFFIILFTPQIPKSENRLVSALRNMIEGWNRIKQEPKVILLYLVSTVILLALTALQTYLSYVALGERPGLVPMLFLSTLGIIVAFINFTPGALGVKEAIFVFSSRLVRLPNDILVLGSFVLRGISLFTTDLIGGICYWIITRQIKMMDEERLPVLQDEKMV